MSAMNCSFFLIVVPTYALHCGALMQFSLRSSAIAQLRIAKSGRAGVRFKFECHKDYWANRDRFNDRDGSV